MPRKGISELTIALLPISAMFCLLVDGEVEKSGPMTWVSAAIDSAMAAQLPVPAVE